MLLFHFSSSKSLEKGKHLIPSALTTYKSFRFFVTKTTKIFQYCAISITSIKSKESINWFDW